MVQQIQKQGQNFELHPSGAMYWSETDMLLIADVHLGKISHFRKHGSSVPHQAMFQNFEKLNKVITFFNPSVICFLGDLFHSHLNNEWDLFVEWRKSITSKLVLVAGNHDIISPLNFESIGIDVVDKWQIGRVILTHHPCLENQSNLILNISGHIHPGIQLRGVGKSSISIACFWSKQNQLILPAFGIFTGKHIISPQFGDRVFAITDNEVIEVAKS